MKENAAFGECLSEILRALNLKSSKLARELNIDASLVYKWLRSERIPSVDSPYIELLIGYLSKKPLSQQQRTNLAEVLSRHEINLSGTNDAELLDKAKLLLKNVQSLSIRQHDRWKRLKKINTVKCTALDSLSGCLGRNALACDYDSVQIIKGSTNVIASMIDLLKQAPRTPSGSSNAILLTINNDIKVFNDKNGITRVWMQELYTLLMGGWKLILHVSLDGDVTRTIQIIECMQTLLTTGNLSVYYHIKQPVEISGDTELFIIPGTGALLCFFTYKKKLIDSAFLFHSDDSLELLSSRFFQNLNSAEPLLKSYPHHRTSDFQQAFAEYEETPGDKCVFKWGLSTATLPMDLYHKYLELAKVPDPYFSYRTFLHKRRLDAFEEHVQHYHFRDICFWESVIQLVENNRYSFDEEYLFEDSTPQKNDIIRHLEYLIELLVKYDNFNIAFVSMSTFESLHSINWMVKGSSCVLIEIDSRIGSMDNLYPRMNFSITEKSVVHAYHSYFNNLWDSIPDDYKNKNHTIARLKSLIENIT